MYLLDTDICSYVMKRSAPSLIERVCTFSPGELRVSAITVFELEYGANRSGRYETLMTIIQAFLRNVEILPFTVEAAHHSGKIRNELERQGKTIGAYDLLIAGHAQATNAVLVTNNVREFSRVKQLNVENWAR